MENTVVELYKKEELVSLRSAKRILEAVSIAVLAAAFIVCAVLCLKTNVLNSSRMLLLCVLSSVIGGWIFLTIRIFPLGRIRAAIKHIEAMLEGEREYKAGAVSVTDERVYVKNGVPLVSVKSESGTLRVWSEKAEELKKAEAAGVYCVYGFVTAYEAKHEDS